MLNLKHVKPDSKQAVDACKVLKILKSSKAPLVKKRQAMRITFGDYRQKMKDEAASSSKAAQNMKFETPDKEKKKKLQFYNKSRKSHQMKENCANGESENNDSKLNFSSSSNDFKFSFPLEKDTIVDTNDDNKNSSVTTPTISCEDKSNFHFVKSDNSFKFDFKIS
ncbi:hypothetical protein SNE40_014008 [Patella caerulea]